MQQKPRPAQRPRPVLQSQPQYTAHCNPRHDPVYTYRDIGKNLNLPQETVRLNSNMTSTHKKKEKKYAYKNILYSVMLTILGFVVLGIVVITFVSKIQIHTLKMSGDIILPKEILQTQIKIELPQKYFDVNTRDIKDRIEAHPLIYQAKVNKSLSGKLNVILERSNPLVSTLAEVNGVFKPVYFDKLGRCVQVGAGLGVVDVPIISGLTLVNPSVGVYLPEWVQDIIKRLNDIRLQNAKLYKQISEIAIRDMGEEYRILEITFTHLKPRFITNVQIDTHIMMKIWQLGNKIVNSSNTELLNFDYFDIRQGVIIGKRERT